MALPTVAATESLGPANYQARVQAATRAGGLVYAVTFRQSPPHLVAYDPAGGRVVETHEIPAGRDVDSPGAWNLVALGDRYLFTVLHEPTHLFRFDRETGAFDRLAEFPRTAESLRCCRAIEAADGAVVFALKIDPVLFAWDQAEGSLREYDRVHQTALKAIDLAATADRAYVGGGTDAYLTRVDRATGETADALPAALVEEGFVQSVALADDRRLVLGTSPPMHVAAFHPDSPDGATVVEPPVDYSGGSVTALSVVDGVAYFTTTDPSYAIWAHELGTTEVTKVAAPIDHPTRDIFEFGDELLGVGSGGYSAVWRLDPDTGETSTVRLGDVGLPRGAGNLQSFHAMGADVYAGGSRVTAVHHTATGDRDTFLTPGEPKVMCSVEGTLYQAVYGGAGLVAYDPGTGESRELAWIGEGQNRPRALHHHDPTGLLLAGTRPEFGQLGGAIAAYDLDADRLVSVDRHVVPDQTVNAVTSIGEVAYLGTDVRGGIGSDPTAESVHVVAWAPRDREVQWSTALEDHAGIMGLAAHGGRLYGRATDGTFFGFDPETRERTVEHELSGSGDVVAHDGVVYGVDTERLFAYDPSADELGVLVDDLRGEDAWHNFPQLAIGEDGAAYIGREKDLLRVELEE
ncbi:MAG: PQQ-binding-like beta-propeller repeat protein [Halobacteriales archaeon]